LTILLYLDIIDNDNQNQLIRGVFMKNLDLSYDWLNQLLPNGFPYHSSTVVSGAGGTGKPLAAFALLADWLKAGGSVLLLPIQYQNMELVDKSMQEIYGMDLKSYSDQIIYIEFDPEQKHHMQTSKNKFSANLLKVDVWKDLFAKTSHIFKNNDLGTMVYASAINLLLFSPKYQSNLLNYLTDITANDKERTYLFAVSTRALKSKIKQIENAADNLMFTRMEERKELFFSIKRMKNEVFNPNEVKVPISESQFKRIREIAKETKSGLIPKIKKII
jgi:KaiC/GvpD/RAD55 family RecA-like ATPase